MPPWVLGVAISAVHTRFRRGSQVGNATLSIGSNLLQAAYTAQQRRVDSDLDPPSLKSLWNYHAGWWLYLTGNWLTFFSLGLAPLGLVVPVSTLQFVVSALFNAFINHEPTRLGARLALSCMCAGSTLLIAFGQKDMQASSLPALLALALQEEYIIYIAVVFGGVVPLAFCVTAVGHNAYSKQPRPAIVVRSMPIAFSLYAGPIGAQATLYSTCASTLLCQTIFRGSSHYMVTFYSLFFYMTVFAALGLNIIWILLLGSIVWTTTVLVSGSLYFQIYKLSSSLEFGMLALGGALLCLGIYLLTPSKEAAGPIPLEEADPQKSLLKASAIT